MRQILLLISSIAVLVQCAVAQESTSEFQYAGWAKQKPGTRVTFLVTTAEKGEDRSRTTREQVTWTLTAIDAEAATLERTVTLRDPAPGQIAPPARTVIVKAHPTTAPSLSTTQPVGDGEDEMELDGRKVRARWTDIRESLMSENATRRTWAVIEPQVVEVDGQKVQCRVERRELRAGSLHDVTTEWTSSDFPGGLVRRVKDLKGPGLTRTQETVAIGASSSAIAADAVANRARELRGKWLKHKSVSANVKITTASPSAEHRRDTRATGTYLLAPLPEQAQIRMELDQQIEMKAEGRDTQARQKLLYVTDGEYTYVLQTHDGKQTARRLNIELRDIGDPHAQIEFLRSGCAVNLRPGGEVDGRKTVAFEAIGAAEDPGERQRFVLHYDEETGVLVQMEQFFGDKRIETFALSDLKLDAAVPEKAFKFVAPAGVEVQEALTR